MEDTLEKTADATTATASPLSFTIERAVLIKSLARLASVVERKSTIPVLSNILFEVGANEVVLTATDMELLIAEQLEVNVKTQGKTTVPAHTLYDIVRKIPNDIPITFHIEKENLFCMHVKAGKSYFTLPCLPAEEFPRMDAGDMDHRFSLASGEAQLLIEKTRFAMSTEETRYYMNGMYLHTTEGDDLSELKSVSTDGHRLAIASIQLPEGASNMPGVIIPRKTVHELQRILQETEAEIVCSVSSAKIMFKAGPTIILSKLIDGSFPDYTQVIPQDNSATLTIKRAALAEAVDRVATISTEKARGVELTIDQTQVTLHTTGDATTGTDQLQATYDGEPLTIAFNARYLMEVLSVVDADETQIAFGNAQAPAILKDPTHPSVLYLIMPMRV